MAQISGLLCQIVTGRLAGAGTDGSVYLGLGGREFHLDSTDDDYEQGSLREYILGAPPIPFVSPPQIRVQNKDKNDPRKGFPLDTIDVDRTPVYIRFEPEDEDDNWNLRFAALLVYTNQFAIAYMTPQRFDNLWLGHGSGKILYLTFEWRTDGPAGLNADALSVLKVGRKLAPRTRKR